MYEQLDKSVRMFATTKNLPNRIIIGEDAFNNLKAEMKERFAYGLKVNLKSEYTSLFGMEIEIDYVNKNRIEILYYQSIKLE